MPSATRSDSRLSTAARAATASAAENSALVVAVSIVAALRSAQPLSSVAPRTWLFLILSGVATGASWLCYYRALQLGPASRVAPIDKLSVVLVAVLGTVLLGETLSLKGWLGVALIAAGAMLIA